MESSSQLPEATDQAVLDLAAEESGQLFRAIFENVSVGIALVDPQGYVVAANEADCRFLGYSQAELVGMHFTEFTHPEDLNLDADLFHQLVQGTQAHYVIEKRYLQKAGAVVWGRLTVSLLRHPNGSIRYVVVVCEDITEAKHLEQARHQSDQQLHRSEQNYRMLFDCNPHPLWVYDLETLAFLKVNEAAVQKYGYSREEFLQMTIADIRPPEDQPRLRQNVRRVETGLDRAGIWRHRKKDGTLIDVEITSHFLWFDGRRAELVLAHDVSDRLLAEAKLIYSTLHDALTDLPNRELLTQRLQTAIKHSQRQNNPRCAVLFLDLDRFKVINDSLGHLVGDQVLVLMAEKLKSLIRETDLVARLGGDEFVILLEDDEPMKGAIRIAERLFADLQLPFSAGDREVFLSVSIGIVLLTQTYTAATDLLRDADIAMFRAKSQGKGCYEIFDAEMHAYALQRLHLENDLHQALTNQEFVVYYQPIFALQTLQPVGVEALVRWQHPQRGWIGPDEFIDIAEEIGLIIPLDRWMLNAVCQQLSVWNRHSTLASPLKAAVNLSVQDLWNIRLIDQVDQVLSHCGLSGNCLTLEITESMLVDNIETTTHLLEQLKQRGICVSIDDFGTGYSSLSYLHQLPADTLKIDRSFVNQMLVSPKNHKIVETIITLSDQLGIQVVAEGIETEPQLNALRQLGCELGQGYWFAPPMPAAELEAFWLERSSASAD